MMRRVSIIAGLLGMFSFAHAEAQQLIQNNGTGIWARQCSVWGWWCSGPKTLHNLNEIVSSLDLTLCLADLTRFKAVESSFRKKGWNILDAQVHGWPLLFIAILQCDDHYSTQTNRHAVIEYMLSRINHDQLNGVATGTIDRLNGIYYGTAVAVAARNSYWCLEKILTHPLFGATNFLTPHQHPTYPNVSQTPQSCVNYLYYFGDHLEEREAMIHLLVTRFGLHAPDRF